MPTFGDILAGANYASLPQIAAEHVQLLWYVEFWDGPRAGVLRYRDERCWFQVVAENEADEGWYRRFVVVRLTPAQLADEQRWDALFREKVGHHPHLSTARAVERVLRAVRPPHAAELVGQRGAGVVRALKRGARAVR